MRMCLAVADGKAPPGPREATTKVRAALVDLLLIEIPPKSLEYLSE